MVPVLALHQFRRVVSEIGGKKKSGVLTLFLTAVHMLLNANSWTLRANFSETNRRRGICSISFERGNIGKYFGLERTIPFGIMS